MKGLLVKLLRNGIASKMFSWIKSYLYNWRARVSVDSVHSKKILQRHGVPLVESYPLHYSCFSSNDLVSELPNGVKAALYADDLVMWCKEEYATTATYRMQLAADKLNSWTEKWRAEVNKDKSSLFTLSPKQRASTITLGGTPLKEQHTLVSHLTRGIPGNGTLPRQKQKPDAGWLFFANLLVPLREQARKH